MVNHVRDIWRKLTRRTNKKEPKTYVDVNGNEYDTNRYDFVKDWEVRRVARKLENLNDKKTRLGAKLHDIMLEKQKEKEEQEQEKQKEKTKKAKYEALKLFELLEDDFVKAANEGESYYELPVTRLKVIMTKNNMVSDVDDLHEELKEVCKENYIELTTIRGFYDGYLQFCLVFNWDNV